MINVNRDYWVGLYIYQYQKILLNTNGASIEMSICKSTFLSLILLFTSSAAFSATIEIAEKSTDGDWATVHTFTVTNNSDSLNLVAFSVGNSLGPWVRSSPANWEGQAVYSWNGTLDPLLESEGYTAGFSWEVADGDISYGVAPGGTLGGFIGESGGPQSSFVAYLEDSEGNQSVFTGETTSVVPIPAAAWLFGTALFGLAGVSRRKKA